jgi:hypothetical protein
MLKKLQNYKIYKDIVVMHERYLICHFHIISYTGYDIRVLHWWVMLIFGIHVAFQCGFMGI